MPAIMVAIDRKVRNVMDSTDSSLVRSSTCCHRTASTPSPGASR
jgi:hypothetical protein